MDAPSADDRKLWAGKRGHASLFSREEGVEGCRGQRAEGPRRGTRPPQRSSVVRGHTFTTGTRSWYCRMCACVCPHVHTCARACRCVCVHVCVCVGMGVWACARVCTHTPASPARGYRCVGVTRLGPGFHWGQGRARREPWRGLGEGARGACRGPSLAWGPGGSWGQGQGKLRKRTGCRRSPRGHPARELRGSGQAMEPPRASRTLCAALRLKRISDVA